MRREERQHCVIEVARGNLRKAVAAAGEHLDLRPGNETGELLRELFLEGTKPTSEEVAGRIGFAPLDTGPLVANLSAG